MNTRDETTGTDPGSKSAAEIEREVKQSRADVEQTLDRIQDRFSPGQLMDQAVTYFRDGGGGEFTRNLGESIKQNPMPLALVAIGVGWMMLSSQRSGQNGYHSEPSWDARTGDVGDKYVGLADEHRAFGSPSDPDAGGSFGDRAKDAGRGAKEKLGEFGDRAKGKAGELGDQTRDLADQARERVERAGSDVADQARDAGERARNYGRRAKRSVLQTINDQPLILAGIGLAIGAALGAAVPPSEVEDELMGETRDDALRRVKEVGLEQAEKARDAAGAIVGAARDEADKQGLTPEAESETAGKAGDTKTAGVAGDIKTAGVAGDTKTPGMAGGAPSFDREETSKGPGESRNRPGSV